jgi:superfamily II DNA or RNA helicase
VGPVYETIPLKIDLTGVKRKETAEGRDLDRMEVGKRIAPFLDDIAREIAKRAGKGKILLFLPSVETAQLMSVAMNKAGISCRWVCGDKKLCPDRTKIVAAHKANQFQALCNMALLTEGYDDDEIQYLVPLRPTEIWSLYAQMIGRGTRPHGSIVKALNMASNAYERIQIIKNSAKPKLIVFDFLWLHEKHNLVQRASLVAPTAKIAKEMGESDGDLIAHVARAEVDLLKKLEDQVRKNADREATTIDPLAMATELADVELADYEPETFNDRLEATPNQLNTLRQNGIALEKVKCRGHATALILRIVDRHNQGLCTIRQLHFFKDLGVDASQMTREEAKRRQDEAIQAKASKNFMLTNAPAEQEGLVW